MIWSKLSSSSFFSVAHILIISGRVPKIDITFIFRVPCWRGLDPWLRDWVSRRARGKNRNLGQRKDHPAAFGQITAVLLADFVEKAPGEDEQVVGGIIAIEDRAGKNLEMRFWRIKPGLRGGVVDHVVEVIMADAAILDHGVGAARGAIAGDPLSLAAQFAEQFDQPVAVSSNGV